MNVEKAHEARELDLTAAARGVWLVKVPKYLSEKWNNATATCDVGKLKITKSRVPGAKPEVIFSLSDELIKMPTQLGHITAATSKTESTSGSPAPGASTISTNTTVPKDHKFVLTGITSQHLSVLTQQAGEDEDEIEKVAVEGKVIQRAECRPLGDASYMQLKKKQLEIQNRPQRQVVQLSKVVQNYRPTSAHKTELLYETEKKEKGKRARDDKDKVLDKLFAAFEKHQYYNVKDLVSLTNQPITYLKEILKEFCIYNMKAPHKNMWELKPEYRHYKEKT